MILSLCRYADAQAQFKQHSIGMRPNVYFACQCDYVASYHIEADNKY